MSIYIFTLWVNDIVRTGAQSSSKIYVRALDHLETAPEMLVQTHASEVTTFTFHPDADQIASADSSGEIRIWPVTPYSTKTTRTFSEKKAYGLFFDHSGSLLAIIVDLRTVRLRNLSAPAEAESLPFQHLVGGGRSLEIVLRKIPTETRGPNSPRSDLSKRLPDIRPGG